MQKYQHIPSPLAGEGSGGGEVAMKSISPTL